MKTGIISAIAFVSTLAALHIAALFLPPELTWGFHFLEFLGPLYAAVYALLVVVFIVAAAKGRLEPAVDRLAEACHNRGHVFVAGALALFIVAGFIFRVDVPLLGDSWYLVKNFAGAIRGTEELLPRDEPLATHYLSLVLGLFDVKSYREFLDAIFAGGMLLGAGFLAAAFVTTGFLFPDRRARVVSFLLLCSLPCMVLFYGYVETYAVVLFVVSLYTLAGVLYLGGRVPFAVVTVAFLVQALTHYLTALTLPSLVYLGYLGMKRGKRRDVVAGIAASSVAFFLVLAAVGFDVTSYFSQVPHKHYLPLTAPDDPIERYSSPYTIFSLFHLLDLANLSALLLAPALALMIAGLAARGRDDTPGRGTAPARARLTEPERFLLASVVPVSLFAFVAKFDLGMARDWDVTGPYSFLFVLFALAWYFRRAPSPESARAASIIAGATLLHSVLWWTVVGSGTATVERFRSLMDERLIGQGGMYSANLYLSRYFRQAGMGDRPSAELWLRYILLYPGDIRGYRNVLNNTEKEGAAAAAEKIRGWSRAFGRNPLTDRTMVTLALERGNAALGENRDADAELFYEAALDVDPRSAAGWNNLGTVLARREEFTEAAAMFSRAVGLDSSFADAWFNLGRAWLATGNSAEARQAFSESARLGNRAARSLLSTGNVQP
ncbi:MAG TPA: tetratricopeptide repeat protein [Bacteroidota bacterium]|nr:tetratricopeptide repeat protein [Bacteroidota bacterium]